MLFTISRILHATSRAPLAYTPAPSSSKFLICFQHLHLESCAGLMCRGIACGAGGNGTLEATGQPDFMPFEVANKVGDTSSGEANQGFKKLG